MNILKDLLFNNPKLIINNEVVFDEDNQFLYLFPLNIIDYYKGATNNKIIKYTIHSFICNKADNYIKILDQTFRHELNKNLEIEITENIQDEKAYIKVINFAKQLNCYITINFKNLETFNTDKMLDIVKLSDFIKISVSKLGEQFKQNLDKIIFYKNLNALLLFKAYLNIEDIDKYYNFVKYYRSQGLDYFLLSKELIPLDCKSNPKVKTNYQNKLLQLKELHNNRFGVKIVKDISTLYYPRFELNENNCKVCKVCNLHRHIYGTNVYPCSSYLIAKNQANKLFDISNNFDVNKTYNLGQNCSDCAYIFENDYIDKLMNLGYYIDNIDFEGVLVHDNTIREKCKWKNYS